MSNKRPNCKQLLLDICNDYEQALSDVQKYVHDTDKREFVENGVKRKIEALPIEKRTDGINEISGKVDNVIKARIDDWTAKEKAFFELNGDDITDDIKLLNDVVNPSIEQLQVIAGRYFGKNYTMEQAIFNYCRGKAGLSVILDLPHTQSFEERAGLVNDFYTRMLKPRFIETALNMLYEKKSSIAFSDYVKSYLEIFAKKIE